MGQFNSHDVMEATPLCSRSTQLSETHRSIQQCFSPGPNCAGGGGGRKALSILRSTMSLILTKAKDVKKPPVFFSTIRQFTVYLIYEFFFFHNQECNFVLLTGHQVALSHSYNFIIPLNATCRTAAYTACVRWWVVLFPMK